MVKPDWSFPGAMTPSQRLQLGGQGSPRGHFSRAGSSVDALIYARCTSRMCSISDRSSVGHSARKQLISQMGDDRRLAPCGSMRVDLPFPACEFAQQGIDLGPAIESEFADMHPNSPPEKSGGADVASMSG